MRRKPGSRAIYGPGQTIPSAISAEDVGETVAFLLGPQSRSITGAEFVVDAGSSVMAFDRDRAGERCRSSDLEADAEQIACQASRRVSPSGVHSVRSGGRGALAAHGTKRSSGPTHYPNPAYSLDGIGRGDALCAGFLWGEAKDGDLSFALRSGVALAGLSQTYREDSGWVTRAQLEACVDGSAWETDTTNPHDEGGDGSEKRRRQCNEQADRSGRSE